MSSQVRAGGCKAPIDGVRGRCDVVQPILLFVSADRARIVTDNRLRGAPATVNQILSAGRRTVKEQTRRRLFEKHDSAREERRRVGPRPG
jgi:hypothetical protein